MMAHIASLVRNAMYGNTVHAMALLRNKPNVMISISSAGTANGKKRTRYHQSKSSLAKLESKMALPTYQKLQMPNQPFLLRHLLELQVKLRLQRPSRKSEPILDHLQHLLA